MISFAEKLQKTLQGSVTVQKVVPVQCSDLPQTPEEWIELFDLGFAHFIIDKIEESASEHPDIVDIGIDYGNYRTPPTVIFEMLDGRTIRLELDALVLAFSPRQ
jgi:hypothetical protein